MKKIDVLILGFLLLLYFLFPVRKNIGIFSYKFDRSLVEKYFLSQDIPHDIVGRTFLSDSEIYMTTGYLYAKGELPTKYNFQAPPTIKYLMGFSILFFDNPFILQVVLGIFYVSVTYILGLYVFKTRWVGAVASLFLVFDPLFASLLSQSLLDLGQSVFALFYLFSFLFLPGSFLLQGVFLGLFASSKFWSPAVFFVIYLTLSKRFILKKRIDIKNLSLSFLVAFFVFCLSYAKNFINDRGLFNIFFLEAKTLKYMVVHNSAPSLGGMLVMFLTGKYITWWEGRKILTSDIFNLLWPLVFLVSLFKIILFKNKNDVKYVIYLLPVLYLFYSVTQVPFARYFIIILPYFYLTFSEVIYKVIMGSEVATNFLKGRKLATRSE